MTDENHNTGIESEETKTGVEDNAGDRIDAKTSQGADSENSQDRNRAFEGTIAKVQKMKSDGQEIPADLAWATKYSISKDEEKKPDMRQVIRDETQAMQMEQEISSFELSDEKMKAFNDERDELISRGYSAVEAIERAKAFLKIDSKDAEENDARASRAGNPAPGKTVKHGFTKVSIADFQNLSSSEKKDYMAESTRKNGEVTFKS